MKLQVIFGSLFFSALIVPGWTQTFYVDGTSGNDLWTGLSPVYVGDYEGPKRTLLSAAWAANPFDQVIVMDGLYAGQHNSGQNVFDWIDNKHLHVQSLNGPEDCEWVLFGLITFQKDSFNDSPSHIEGFTIRDQGTPGTDIRCINGSNVRFTNCIFRALYAMAGYGNLEITGAAYPTFDSCIFEDNQSVCMISLDTDGTVTFEKCVFQRNTHMEPHVTLIGARSRTGLVLKDCLFRDNASMGELCCLSLAGFYTQAEVSGCRFEDNYVYGDSVWGLSGIYVEEGAHLNLTDSVIRGNTAYARTGSCIVTGLSCNWAGIVKVKNCRILENGFWGQEGCIFYSSGILFEEGYHFGPDITDVSTLEITDCEISGNRGRESRGLYVWNSACGKIAVKNSRFCNNRGEPGSPSGGIFFLNAFPTSFVVDNCLVAQNYPYGMRLYANENPFKPAEIRNCTVADNGECGILHVTGTISNTIVRGHSTSLVSSGAGWLSVNYSNIEGGWSGSGTGNIDADPLFADADNCDYHLKSLYGRYDPVIQDWVQDAVHSPCIDAGDPAFPIGAEPLNAGGVINMGVFGGTAQAGKSGLCSGEIYGDINRDCVVNLADVAVLSGAWRESTAEPINQE